MKQIVHVANTNVEFEFAQGALHALEQSWTQHPLCLQLQFLPLLYAQSDEAVAVTALPSLDYMSTLEKSGWWPDGVPHLLLLQERDVFKGNQCQSWGPSRQVQAWAEARQMNYTLPKNWETICLVNSKAFSFRYTCLAEAALLHNEQELNDWLQKIQGPKILKTCFGLSGKGNRYLEPSLLSSDVLCFCRKEWQQGRPLIGEPWLDRLHDFSTQWLIHPNQQIEWVGATRFETDARGLYQGTLAGPEEILFASLENFLQQHRQIVQKALVEMASMGFFGFVGIDALLYRHPQKHSICLYPLVEINARRTMSLVALQMQKRLCPRKILRLSFESNQLSSISLLPNQLISSNGKTHFFQKRLQISILD